MAFTMPDLLRMRLPLTHAVLSGGSGTRVAALLSSRPSRLEQEEVVPGFTPLFAAILAGNGCALHLLLAHPYARPSAQLPDSFEWESLWEYVESMGVSRDSVCCCQPRATPLSLAVTLRHKGAVEALLAAGARARLPTSALCVVPLGGAAEAELLSLLGLQDLAAVDAEAACAAAQRRMQALVQRGTHWQLRESQLAGALAQEREAEAALHSMGARVVVEAVANCGGVEGSEAASQIAGPTTVVPPLADGAALEAAAAIAAAAAEAMDYGSDSDSDSGSESDSDSDSDSSGGSAAEGELEVVEVEEAEQQVEVEEELAAPEGQGAVEVIDLYPHTDEGEEEEEGEEACDTEAAGLGSTLLAAGGAQEEVQALPLPGLGPHRWVQDDACSGCALPGIHWEDPAAAALFKAEGMPALPGGTPLAYCRASYTIFKTPPAVKEFLRSLTEGQRDAVTSKYLDLLRLKRQRAALQRQLLCRACWPPLTAAQLLAAAAPGQLGMFLLPPLEQLAPTAAAEAAAAGPSASPQAPASRPRCLVLAAGVLPPLLAAAVAGGHLGAAKLLLQLGASAEGLVSGVPLLALAATQGSPSMMELLRSMGARYKAAHLMVAAHRLNPRALWSLLEHLGLPSMPRLRLPRQAAHVAPAAQKREQQARVKCQLEQRCPFYVVLSSHVQQVQRGNLPAADAEWRAAQCARVLRQARLKPSFLQACLRTHPRLAATLQLGGLNRLVWQVCTGVSSAPGWSPSTHALYPPRFRAAIRVLLLAAHRQRRRWPSMAAALGNQDLLQVLLHPAVHPVDKVWALEA